MVVAGAGRTLRLYCWARSVSLQSWTVVERTQTHLPLQSQVLHVPHLAAGEIREDTSLWGSTFRSGSLPGLGCDQRVVCTSTAQCLLLGTSCPGERGRPGEGTGSRGLGKQQEGLSLCAEGSSI